MKTTGSNPRSTFAALLALGIAASLAACGGGGGNDILTNPPPPPPTQPSQPSRANVAMSIANPSLRLSPRGGFNYRLEFDVTVRESAGVGATLNFMRADFLDAGGAFLERQEAGSNVLNRLQANGTLAGHAEVDFNTGRVSVAVITLGYRDDRGNSGEQQARILFQ
ncbi:MAG: hypothetical protein HY317_01075 [Acidobacteria bacterium]|nr:hypothetical protein [Acidobacteriota bacterium]